MPRGTDLDLPTSPMPAAPAATLSFEVSDLVREQVLHEAGYRCENPWCAQALTARPEIDHIVSRSEGGDHDRTNLQCLCLPCNRSKGHRSEETFRQGSLIQLWQLATGTRLRAAQVPSTPSAFTGAVHVHPYVARAPQVTLIEELINRPERLLSQIDQGAPDECWPWTGYVNAKTGRPELRMRVGGGRTLRTIASRAALMLHLGRELGPKLFACHTCDNPLCCNPAHLWEDTNAGNLADMVSKGRSGQGERNPNAKLTNAQVKQIMTRHASGATQKELAAHYDVAKSTISYVIKRGNPEAGDLRRLYAEGAYDQAIRDCASALGKTPTLSAYKRWRAAEKAAGRDRPTFSAQVKGGVAWSDRLAAAGAAAALDAV